MVLDLLRALGAVDGANFVVRNADALAELEGPLRVSEDGGWATLERDGCSCHLHLRLEQLAEARFAQEPGFAAGTTAYCVQFFHVAGDRPVLMVYMPAEAFHRLLAQFGGRDLIAFKEADELTS